MLCLLTFAKKEKAPCESAAQLFLEVLTETVEKTRTVDLLPHFGQLASFTPWSAMCSVFENVFPQSEHRYSYTGMPAPSYSRFRYRLYIRIRLPTSVPPRQYTIR